MNERIKNMAPQFWEMTAHGLQFNQMRFAEAIIRECLGIVNRHEYSYHEADPLWQTAQLIKEHFGVEE